MTLEELRALGVSPTRRGWLSNPARRLLWPFVAPYLRGLLDAREAEAARSLQRQSSHEAATSGALQQLHTAMQQSQSAMQQSQTAMQQSLATLEQSQAALRQALEQSQAASQQKVEQLASAAGSQDEAVRALASHLAAMGKDLTAIHHRLASFEEATDLGVAAPAMAAETVAAPARSELSWSQCGEDRIIVFLLQAIGAPEAIRYLDIGAADPSGHSNTYLFYRRGGSGLLVEADPSYGPAYAAQRPRDLVEHAAVVPAAEMPQDGQIAFHLAGDRGWNSIYAEHVAEAERLGKGSPRQVVSVPATTIGAILDRHFAHDALHLLSIDIEGVDNVAIREIDFTRHQPWVLVVETMGNADLDAFLGGHGYALYGSTHVNRIYVRRDLLDRARF
jgi:FkbM family methyltransferase